MSAKAAKRPTKQLPLFEAPPVSPDDVLADEDRQERHRLSLIAKAANEARHERWQEHNRGRFNFRLCPCDKPECKAKRR